MLRCITAVFAMRSGQGALLILTVVGQGLLILTVVGLDR